MSYNLENNKSFSELLLSHLLNLARFSLHSNQKAIEHCLSKSGPLDHYRQLSKAAVRTCWDGRVAELFPMPWPTPEVYDSVCRPALGLLGHTLTPLMRNCPIFERWESADSTILWQRGSQDCTESPFSCSSGRSSWLTGLWTFLSLLYTDCSPIPYEQQFKCLHVTPCYCLIILCLLLDLLSPCNTAEILVHHLLVQHLLPAAMTSVSMPLFPLWDKNQWSRWWSAE